MKWTVRHMRILFDSKLSQFKTPFGTLKKQEVCTLHIMIPCSCRTTAVCLVLQAENGAELRRVPFAKQLDDTLYDTWGGELTISNAGLYFYYFHITTQDGAFRLFKQGESDTNMEDGGLWQLSVLEDKFPVPDDCAGAVMYQIFPDRFYQAGACDLAGKIEPYWVHENKDDVPVYLPDANGEVLNNDFYGGNLNGIREKLPYLHELGVELLYLNPIFYAWSTHRYDTCDYKRIDPMLGTEEDFRALCNAAHALGMKVILDGVFNHVSSDHPFFRDVLEKGRASRYYSCFYALPETPRLPAAGELPGYTCFSYVADMPKTNTADPFLRQYFCDVGANWVRKFDVDGWRLDVANELDDGFLRAFRASVKAAKSDALIVGEVWENAAHYLGGDMLDSAMNYDFRRYCRRFFAEQTVDAETFDTNVSTLLLRYNENALFAQLNLLDSHDVSRFLSLCGGKTERMELAVLLQMTFPGMPCVFYGDEKGLCGESEPEYRRPMAWDASSPLEEVYRRMIALRKTHPALRYGSFHTELACGGVYRYSRVWNGTKITVAMNLGAEPVKAEKRGTLLLKKGENRDIIGAWEYEVWEEQNDGGNDL